MAADKTKVVGSTTPRVYQVEVTPAKPWTDTRIDVWPGEKLRFNASGIVGYHHGKKFGPDGKGRGFVDLGRDYSLPNAGHGALIGRVGSGEGAQPVLIGESLQFEVPVAGRLFLGLNQGEKDGENASGSFHVKIEVLSAGSSITVPLAGPAETPIPSITHKLLDDIPRRVTDHKGNPGDMVNVLLVGYKDQVLQVFKTAGWLEVDSTVQETMLTAMSDTLARKNYLTLPMSRLYLFGRYQDYGLVHAEPVKVAKSRHHLRLWKSTYEVEGRPLWCVAATHDIGFERDKRDKIVPTHKIDPNIDEEREYVNETLSGTGLVVQRAHMKPSKPVMDSNTASGGEFHTDGRVLVLVLKKDRAEP
ncbi:MAG: LssY C-terminal domain-containing protein [Terriglobales bacterium]